MPGASPRAAAPRGGNGEKGGGGAGRKRAGRRNFVDKIVIFLEIFMVEKAPWAGGERETEPSRGGRSFRMPRGGPE